MKKALKAVKSNSQVEKDQRRFAKVAHSAEAHLSMPEGLNGLRRTLIPVAPMMEQALGYKGNARYVAFHWEPRYHSLCWSAGPFHRGRSRSAVWEYLFKHPAVAPFLTGFNFRAPDSHLGLEELLASSPERLDSLNQLADLGAALLLDRKDRVVYVGPWTEIHAFQALASVDDAGLESDPETDIDEEPSASDTKAEAEFLIWLTAQTEKSHRVSAAIH